MKKRIVEFGRRNGEVEMTSFGFNPWLQVYSAISTLGYFHQTREMLEGTF